MPAGQRKIAVRSSKIHGKGVFALVDIPKKTFIIEYKGERIDWQEALRRHPHDPQNPNHTFYFDIDNNMVIDGRLKGNSAKWINHSCSPNCQAEQEEIDGKQRVFIYAKRNIAAGEELNYDYGLTIDEKITKKLEREYKCLCGSKKCRGTLLRSTFAERNRESAAASAKGAGKKTKTAKVKKAKK
ncbi:MAG TPA: SET domain-containing protein-lysine N-methyltransferase [Burkholderiaceae bacterium]|nr:SET domain-containing protein-lysine N-methyltransferase [Burkholderiaceae bacterium]